MTGGECAEIAPDPSWSAPELISRAEACMALSPAWLVPLAAVAPHDLGPDDKLTLALVLQRMVGVTESLALAALGEVPYRSCVPDPTLVQTNPEAAARVCPGGTRCGHGWQLDELAALSGLPAWLMSRRMGWADALRHDWARLAPLLADGLLSTEHLRRFERATTGAGLEATEAAVTAAVDLATDNPGLSADALARTARRTVERHTSPDEALERRRKNTAEEIGVSFYDLHDGLAAVTLTAEAPQIEAIKALVRDHPALTHPAPGDPRTKGRRQADLLIGVCLGAYDLQRPSAAGRERPGSNAAAGSAAAAEPSVGVVITASLETLLGLSNEPALLGGSIVPAALARHWAADPAWARRAVLDHNGVVSSLSRRQRHPADRLSHAVRHRWGCCTFPGCGRPARASQLDHAVGYAIGGETTIGNLHPLCTRHHRLKEQPGVHVRLNTDGTATWTLPSRRTVIVAAPDQRPPPGPYDSATGRDDRHVEREPWEPPEDHGDPDYEAQVRRQIAADGPVEPRHQHARPLWFDDYTDAA